MKIESYRHRGGEHIESTVMAGALAHAGLLDPTTGEPLSEAVVFGIAGGVGAGLSFCPSVLRSGHGAGITVVGRHRSAVCDGGWHRGLLDRLGVDYEVTESSSANAASKKLAQALAQGSPVVVQCSKGLPYYGPESPTCAVMQWAWDVVVVSVDADAGVAEVGDLTDGTLLVPLEELARVRAQTCTHKNRSFRVPPVTRKLTKKALKGSLLEGVRACAQAMREPRMKTFSLQGVAKWAKSIGNTKAKSGWLRTFPGGQLYWALRDVFSSIEVDGPAGLMRPMYAEFLDHAAGIVGKRRVLEACAQDYRALGAEWTALAEAALPDRVKPFKQTKSLLRKQVALFAEKGARAAKQMARNRNKLAEIDAAMHADFPLDDDAAGALLGQLQTRIQALHEHETATLERLSAI